MTPLTRNATHADTRSHESAPEAQHGHTPHTQPGRHSITSPHQSSLASNQRPVLPELTQLRLRRVKKMPRRHRTLRRRHLHHLHQALNQYTSPVPEFSPVTIPRTAVLRNVPLNRGNLCVCRNVDPFDSTTPRRDDVHRFRSGVVGMDTTALVGPNVDITRPGIVGRNVFVSGCRSCHCLSVGHLARVLVHAGRIPSNSSPLSRASLLRTCIYNHLIVITECEPKR